jgi:hypothetical protein
MSTPLDSGSAGHTFSERQCIVELPKELPKGTQLISGSFRMCRSKIVSRDAERLAGERRISRRSRCFPWQC